MGTSELQLTGPVTCLQGPSEQKTRKEPLAQIFSSSTVQSLEPFLSCKAAATRHGRRLELLERPVQGTVLLVESWALLLKADQRQNDLH